MSNRDKKIPDKFQDVTGFTFTTVGGEMMIVFHGFYDDFNMHINILSNPIFLTNRSILVILYIISLVDY